MSAPELEGVRAVSFDLDDTFWDCAPAIERAEGVLRQWLAREAPRVLEVHDPDEVARHRRALVEAEPALAGDVTELRKRSLAELFRRAEHEHALSEVAFDVFYRARSEVVLYEGVVELLDALAPRYRVAAITNGNADLGLIGIADRFELILHASTDWEAKPAPAMFEHALERFGIEAHELAHVGDSAYTDVGGANAIGARAVWFNPERSGWDDAWGAAPALDVGSIGELGAALLGD